MTNRTLGTLLRVLIKHQAKAWDLLLPHAEFAYNKTPSKATGLSPFKVVYGVDPLSPLDLIPRPLDQKPSADAAARVEEIQKLHELVKARIEKTTLSYTAQANKHKREKLFKPGDLVWIHLRKERFPTKRKTKLMPRADGPFEILEKINDNAYKVELPGDYGVSATFNVADLSPYEADDYLSDLRIKSSQQGENDGGPSTRSTNIQMVQNNQETRSKVTAISHLMERLQADAPGFPSRILPGFCYLITQV